MPTKYKENYCSLIEQNVKEMLSEGDLLLINLESAIASYEFLSRRTIQESVYIAPDETLNLLSSIKVPVIANIANNHFSQHGKDVVEYSLEKLKAHNIMILGYNNQPLTIYQNGLYIRLWGVSLVKDKYYSDYYFRSTYTDLIDNLKLVAKEPDEIRIISIHWGEEYITKPSLAQRELAYKLIDQGFDLILGHHPHVIQEVEKVNNSWIVYSHGNFLFDQNFSSLTQKGLVSSFAMPEMYGSFYFTQQKHHKVVEMEETTVEQVNDFCRRNYSPKTPFKMRVKMKAELLLHPHELNMPIIKVFGKKILGIN
jgi:poly-gamma-glutamate synthesis protein (capsule biosynthesis protein)